MAEDNKDSSKPDSGGNSDSDISFNIPQLKEFLDNVKKTKDELNKLKQAGGKMSDAIGKGMKNAAKEVGNLAGKAGKAAATVLSASGISLGMDSVVSSMKAGFTNLEQTSEEYALSVKSVKDAQEELGGSIAGALAPAIQTVAPVLAELIGYVNSAVETFGPFFAQFIGENSGSLIAFKDSMVQMVSEINWTSLVDSLKGLWETLEPFAEAIGQGLADLWNNVLVPLGTWVIGTGLPALLNFISGIVSNELAMSILEGIALAIGSIAVAALLYNTAMTIAAAVTGAFGAVMTFLTSPVGIVILAIGALIAIGVLLWKNWEVVCEKISDVWNAISGAVTSVMETIRQFIEEKITMVRDCITGVLGSIKEIWDKILYGLSSTAKTVFEGIWSVIKTIINGILGGIEGMANGIIKGVNLVIGALNNLRFDIPDWVPGLGGKTFGFNISEMREISLPRLATGGIATRPVAALIGEAGREAVLPLDNNTGWMDALAQKLADRMTLKGNGPVYLQVDGQTFARLEMPYFQAENGRIGLNFGRL